MTKTINALLITLALVTSCDNKEDTRIDLTTWEKTRDIALLKVKANEYDFIVDHLISEGLADAMIEKYGEVNWKTEFQKKNLKLLPYYFGWLKDCTIEISDDKVILTGQHGCYAIFINVNGSYLFLDFGQHITSM